MIPKSIPKRLAERIEHYDDEREIGNSIIVSLKNSWKFSRDPFEAIHVEGFDTVREVIQALRETEKCRCQSCIEGAS